MYKALQLVSSLLEADPDEVDPRAYVRQLPPREPRIAYALLPSEMADPSITHVHVIVVKEGEGGYWWTDWRWRKNMAQAALDQQNAKLGLSPEEADEIFTRSLFPPKKRKRKIKEAQPDRLDYKNYALKHGRPCRFIPTWDGWKCGCGRWSFTTSVFDTTGVEKKRAKQEWLDHKARISEALDPDDIPPKGALMQVPSPYESLKSEIKPGDGITATMRVILKRSLRRGEWVTRLENMETGGEFWGHYFDDYEVALRDFESRCLKLGVSPIPAERYIEEAVHLVATLLETSPDEVDPVRYLKDLAGPNKRIRISYNRTTPESVEQGDLSGNGWIDEEGEDITPDFYDTTEGITAVDKAVKFLQYEGVIEASSSQFSPGEWYIGEWGIIDQRTGEQEVRNYHLVGFTPEEEKEIHDRVIRRRQ